MATGSRLPGALDEEEKPKYMKRSKQVVIKSVHLIEGL
jgi:hypothetical protein